MRTIESLSLTELREIVSQIRDALYKDEYDGSLDPNKHWFGDTFEDISRVIAAYGLVPDRKSDRDGRPVDGGRLAALDDHCMDGEGEDRQLLFCTPACRREYLSVEHPDDHQSYGLSLLAPREGETCRQCDKGLPGLPETRFKEGKCPTCGGEMETGDEFIGERICPACVDAQEHDFDAMPDC